MGNFNLYYSVFYTLNMDQKITKDLGTLNSKVLLFGGVYSNLQALEALKKIADSIGISNHNILCTGDIVGYCAQPEECITAIKEWGIKSIAGNVEEQLIKGEKNCGCDFNPGSRCDDFSKEWYPFAQSKVSKSSIEWLATLPNFITFTYADKKCIIIHGSYKHTSEFIFKSTPWATKLRNFETSKADIIIAGHCGLPFHETKDQKTWINAGVIGMPANNGSQNVWYVILDQQNGKINFKHHELTYDFEKANSLMTTYNLPKAYAETLKTGIWDNCEILPPQEAALQGQSIIF